MLHNLCDWAKYQNIHSSKSIQVIKLSFCQNDPPIGGSFWQKNSLITIMLFELCLFMIFSPVANLMHHPLVGMYLIAFKKSLIFFMEKLLFVSNTYLKCYGTVFKAVIFRRRFLAETTSIFKFRES